MIPLFWNMFVGSGQYACSLSNSPRQTISNLSYLSHYFSFLCLNVLWWPVFSTSTLVERVFSSRGKGRGEMFSAWPSLQCHPGRLALTSQAARGILAAWHLRNRWAVTASFRLQKAQGFGEHRSYPFWLGLSPDQRWHAVGNASMAA